MKALRSKFVSLFAAIALVAGLIPTFAFAEITNGDSTAEGISAETSIEATDDTEGSIMNLDGDETGSMVIMPLDSSTTKDGNSVASVQTGSGTLYYDNLQEAWDSAINENGAVTISFLASLTVSGSFELPAGSNADITFKYSGIGGQLTSTSPDPLFVVNGGNLYVNTGTYNCEQLIEVNGGTASIGGIGTGSKTQSIAVNNGSLDLLSSSAATFGSAKITGGNLIITKVQKITELTATGGTITQSTGVIDSGSIASGVTFTSTGGTINGLQINGSTVDLSGITANNIEISAGDITFSGTTLNSSNITGGTLNLNAGTINDLTKSGGTVNVGDVMFTSADRNFLEIIGLSSQEIEGYYVGTNSSKSRYSFAKNASDVATALGIGAGSMITLLHVPNNAGDISINSGIFVENGTASTITVNGEAIDPGDNNSSIRIYVNDELYYTLGSALDAASNGDTVKLDTDVPVSSPVTIASSITLDLNGHAINGSTTSSPMISINGEDIVVTITDLADGSGSIISTKSTRAITVTQGSLNLEAGTIANSNGSGTGIYVSNGTTFAMTGGTISSTQTGLYIASGGTASIINGTISSAPTTVGSATIYCASNGKLTIEGGVFTDRSSTKTKYVIQAASSAQAIINGGTFTGTISGNSPGLTVYGGSFSSQTNSAQWLAEGYVIIDEGNGYSKVVLGDESSFVAEVNGVKYGQLSQAISIARSGDTVTLLQDAVIINTISISTKSITFDLNGNNIIPANSSVSPLFDIYCTPAVTAGVNLAFTGNGIVGSGDTDMAIRMRASTPATTVTIGPKITVEGDTPIFIQPMGVNSDASNAVANLNVEGTVTSPDDRGSGINVHGQLINGVANITLENTATVKGYLGIYQGGNANTVVNGGTIEGSTGIEARSGKLTMNDGTIVSTASSFSTNSNASGSTTVGAAIAVSQHTTKRPIEIIIENGRISGYVGLAIVNTIPNNNPDDIGITISGGDFIATGSGNDSRSVSVQSGYAVTEFVKGGNFSDSLMDTGYLSPTLTAQLWSTQKNENAPFSYYPTMTDALKAAEDDDVVTSVITTENTERTVPIIFNSGYDNISISVQYPDVGEMTVPDNQYFQHPDGLQFQGWLVEKIPPIPPGVVDSDVPSAEGDDDSGIQKLAESGIGKIVQAGDPIELPSKGLLLTAQWGTKTADQVDKSALESAVDEAIGKVQSNYTPQSWEAFYAALAEAQKVLQDPSASQDEVDAAIALLTAAMEVLEPVNGNNSGGETTVDKSALETAIAAAKGKNESLYTPQSWKVLLEAIAAAQAVLDDPEATQSEIDAATALVNSALNALVKKDKPGSPGSKVPIDDKPGNSASEIPTTSGTQPDGKQNSSSLSDTGDPVPKLALMFGVIALTSSAVIIFWKLNRRRHS